MAWDFDLERHDKAVECPECGGYAPDVKPSKGEEEKFGCGRPHCCARAYTCNRCKWHGAASAPPPEME